MKFICTQDNIQKGLGRAVSLAGRNIQLPILQHVLVQVRGGVLQFTCTDLEVGIKASVPGKVEKEGECTIPARQLYEYVQQLPNTHPVILEQKGGKVYVTTEGFTAQFLIGNSDDYPLIPQPNEEKKIDLPADEFCNALNQVIFAAARDDTRPEIHSVYVNCKEGDVKVVATDSFRLAEAVVSIPKVDDFSFLLPLFTAQEIVRLYAGDESLTLLFHENYLTFQGEGAQLSSRLIDGKYPDYEQVIPKSHPATVTISRTEMIRALKTLAVFLPRDSRRIEVDTQPKKDMFVLTVSGNDSGEGTVQVPVEGGGAAVRILFNIQYILEGLQKISGERCKILYGTESDPVVIKPLDDGIPYTYVVMPIQT